MSTTDLRIGWASHASARFACEHWHYSGKVPMPPLVRIGVWENGRFTGVVIFSRGASPNLLVPYGLKQFEGCELTRVALNHHITPVSRILRIAVRFLKKTNSGLKLIVSFADQAEGHHGGIYQAANWTYAGETTSAFKYKTRNGKVLKQRQVAKTGVVKQFGKLTRVPKTGDCVKIPDPPKHRYLMALNAATRKQITSLAQPYPKRLKQGDDCGLQDSGGATPTQTLQAS